MPESLLDRPTVYGARAKLGVIVPPTNTSNEAEWQAMAPAGVTIHSARMPLHTDTESEAGKAALYEDVRRFTQDLAQMGPDVIAYGCTAGSMVTPVTGLPDFMTAEGGRPSVTTAQAIVEALRALGVSRLSVATPYHDALNDHEVAFLTEQGFEVLAIEGLGYGAAGPQEYRNVSRITPDVVFELACRVDRPEAEAILLSCTDLATLDVIARLEDKLEKPVISSNTATFWMALREAGIDDRINGVGQLLEQH